MKAEISLAVDQQGRIRIPREILQQFGNPEAFGLAISVDERVVPDPDDRHVLAAAIAGKASKIVTWNLRDFPGQIIKGFGIAAQTPDAFVAGLIANRAGVRAGHSVSRRRALGAAAP